MVVSRKIAAMEQQLLQWAGKAEGTKKSNTEGAKLEGKTSEVSHQAFGVMARIVGMLDGQLSAGDRRLIQQAAQRVIDGKGAEEALQEADQMLQGTKITNGQLKKAASVFHGVVSDSVKQARQDAQAMTKVELKAALAKKLGRPNDRNLGLILESANMTGVLRFAPKGQEDIVRAMVEVYQAKDKAVAEPQVKADPAKAREEAEGMTKRDLRKLLAEKLHQKPTVKFGYMLEGGDIEELLKRAPQNEQEAVRAMIEEYRTRR